MDNQTSKPSLPKLKEIALKVLPFSALELNEGQLDGLPANPREIHTAKFELLKKNIEEHPEFLQYNALKVFDTGGGKYIIIGGNMRFRAMQELGYESAPCAILDPATTVEQLKAYVILDNSSFGKWEWSMLANEWDAAQLKEWGVECEVLSDDFFVADEPEPEGDLNDYEAPEKECLECPHCHHVDSKVHFKKVEGKAKVTASTEPSDEDISLGD